MAVKESVAYAKHRLWRARREASLAGQEADDVAGRLSPLITVFNEVYTAGESQRVEAEEAARQSDLQTAIERFQSSKTRFEDAAKALTVPAVLVDPEAELANVRTVAKEWLAAALALFGLLSFSALFFGGDALAGFKSEWVGATVFLSATVLAVVCALLCNFFGTRAAHGWPHTSRRNAWRVWDRDVGGLRKEDDAVRKTEKAITDLKASMAFATFTVLLIVVVVCDVVIDQIAGAKAAQFIQVYDKADKRLGCGTLSQGDTPDAFKISTVKDNVTVESNITWAQVGRFEAKKTC